MSKGVYSKRGCCVVGCHNSGQKLKVWALEACEIHRKCHEFCSCVAPYELYTFPTVLRNNDLRQAWVRCVNRQVHGKLWEPNKDSRICSEHFVTGHPYPVVNMGHERISTEHKLPKRKVPLSRTQGNEHAKKLKTESVSGHADLQMSEESLPVLAESHEDVKGNVECPRDHDYDVNWNDMTSECDGCSRRNVKIKTLMETISKQKEEINKLKSQQKQQKQQKLREDDAVFKQRGKMMVYTGMEKQIFDTIYACLLPKIVQLRYWKGATRTVNNVRRFIKPGPKRLMSPKSEFLMCMFKLKTGLHMEIIGDMFGVSKSQVSRICVTWWRFLAKELGSLVFNPEKHSVIVSRPKAFDQAPYRDVRHIVDCTEIYIETPKSLKLNASCWSDYKHHHTVKFLVSINPNGHINYVSKGWVGRSSDNHVTEYCGWLDILEPYDKVMADRGFQIQKLLAQQFVTLVCQAVVSLNMFMV